MFSRIAGSVLLLYSALFSEEQSGIDQAVKRIGENSAFSESTANPIDIRGVYFGATAGIESYGGVVTIVPHNRFALELGSESSWKQSFNGGYLGAAFLPVNSGNSVLGVQVDVGCVLFPTDTVKNTFAIEKERILVTVSPKVTWTYLLWENRIAVRAHGGICYGSRDVPYTSEKAIGDTAVTTTTMHLERRFITAGVSLQWHFGHHD